MRRPFYPKLILLTIVLAACGSGSNSQNLDGDPAKTEIALTVQAVLLTGNPTQPSSPDITVAPQPSLTPQPSPDTQVSPDDLAAFISDISIPDYSTVQVNAVFTKTWRIQNTSQTTWTTEYNFFFDNGEQMDAPDSIPFPHEVPPDGLIDLTIEFTAPANPGEYRSNWLLKNPDGEIFGIGKSALPIYVIIVAADNASSGSSGGLSGGANITNATITIDNSNYSGACPITVTLSGSISANNAGNTLWSLNLNSSTAGFSFDPSGSYSLTFGDGGGAQFWQYTLTISSSVNATATLNVSGANAYTSNTQSFSINCQ